MKALNPFKAVFAVPTPFDQSLQLSRSALKEHLRVLSKAGVTSILVNGTTGEFPSLTLAERKIVLEVCRTEFSGEVMNNIGTCSISDSLELLTHSHEFADAVVMLPPFYFAPVTTLGLKDFFYAVLSKARISSYLYNFPRYTQLAISPRLLQTIAEEIGLLRGIKDSNSGLESAILMKQAIPRLQVLSGNDDSLVEAHSAGLDGVVTGGCNAFPELVCSIRRTILSGHTAKALALQRLLDQWRQFLLRVSLDSISAAKLGIFTRIAGYPKYVRPPLVAAEQQIESEAGVLVDSLLQEHESIINS